MSLIDTSMKVHEKIIEILVLEQVCLSCPCKKSADLHPRQGNLQHRSIFTGLNKTFLYYAK
jgi:hypothetical protein